MRYLTQTHLHPGGNCWQTALACILDVDPAELPDQHAIEMAKGSVGNALRAYLFRHHGLGYDEQTHAHLFPQLKPSTDAPHLLIGPTVRTHETGALHVVVGVRGCMVWDPHPSRAGLVAVEKWGFLHPFVEKWRQTWERVPCVCPRCPTSTNPLTLTRATDGA